MEVLNATMLGAGLAAGLATLTVLLLGSSLRRVLLGRDERESHARFWFAFACIGIVLTTLFCAVTEIRTRDPALRLSAPQLGNLVATFRAGLFGLLLSLAGLAFGLLLSTRERPSEPGARPAPETGA